MVGERGGGMGMAEMGVVGLLGSFWVLRSICAFFARNYSVKA